MYNPKIASVFYFIKEKNKKYSTRTQKVVPLFGVMVMEPVSKSL